jgi:hypothetical protein
LDIQHISQRNVFLRTHVPLARWEELRAVLPTDAEICRRLRIALHAAVTKIIEDDRYLDGLIESLPSRAAPERGKPS